MSAAETLSETTPTPAPTPAPVFSLARPPGAVVMGHDIDDELVRLGQPAVYERVNENRTLQVFDWRRDPRVLELTIRKDAKISEAQTGDEGAVFFHTSVSKPGVRYSSTDIHIYGLTKAPKPGDVFKGKVRIRVRRIMPQRMNRMGDTYCNSFFLIDFFVEPDPGVEVQGRLYVDANHLSTRDFNDSVLRAREIKHRAQWIRLMTQKEAADWDKRLEKAKKAKAEKDEAAADTEPIDPVAAEALSSGDDSAPTMAGLLGGAKV
jgi:hypothetical protein